MKMLGMHKEIDQERDRKIHAVVLMLAHSSSRIEIASDQHDLLLLYIRSLTVGLMSSQWKNDKSIQTWTLPKSCRVFSAKYDEILCFLRPIL